MTENWEAYQREIAEACRQLDSYEISFSMFLREVERLRKKHGLPPVNYGGE